MVSRRTRSRPFTIDIAPANTDVAAGLHRHAAGGDGGAVYNFAFTGITGSPAPTFTVDPATIAGGITISPDGVLSGTPTTAGSFPITVTATNGVAPDAVKTFTLVVNPAEAPPPALPAVAQAPAGARQLVPAVPRGPLTTSGTWIKDVLQAHASPRIPRAGGTTSTTVTTARGTTGTTDSWNHGHDGPTITTDRVPDGPDEQ